MDVEIHEDSMDKQSKALSTDSSSITPSCVWVQWWAALVLVSATRSVSRPRFGREAGAEKLRAPFSYLVAILRSRSATCLLHHLALPGRRRR